MDKTGFKTEYAAARRAWIGGCFSSLNEMQREAVLDTEGPVLILAGAGSGKTTVLIQRIANLLRFGSASDSDELPDGADSVALDALKSGAAEAEPYAKLHPVPPWRILAITFTNKAADELKTRLETSLNCDTGDIWSCTFHAACVRILRRDAEALGYGSGFTIYDSADSLSLMKHILKDKDLDEKVFPPRAILAEISRAKDAVVLPEEYAAGARQSSDTRKLRIAELYTEYSRRLFAANAMDFDDLILNTVLLLEQFEDRRSYWQQRFSYIMVDEYQDTNRLQYRLISILAEKHRNLCVVGDDDQSIYRFRGATVENILSFDQHYPGCRTVRLEENYRSTEQILEAANQVIRHNHGRKGKELWTGRGRGEPVRLLSAYDENEEAASVANTILSGYSGGMHWRDYAILYRMNAQSAQFEFALKRSGIPYRVVGGARFFDRTEIKDILSYLCVVSDPRDELRLSRIVNVPARGIGDKSLDTARALAVQYGVSLFDILEHADSYPELSRAALRMRQFAAMIRELQEVKQPLDRLYDRVLEKTGYMTMLEQSKDARDESRSENVRELKSSILSFQKDSPDSSLEAYLASIALYTDLDGMDQAEDSVTLMTIHSAKGLEFPVVFVVGMEDGLFPGLRAIGEQDEIEEERRLCYVAFTRAKKQLLLTNAHQRMLFGRTTANRPSRFLEESGIAPQPSETRRRAGSDFGKDSWSSARSRGTFAQKPSVRQDTGAKKPLSGTGTAAPAAMPQLSVGMRVSHQAFGDGTVLKSTPMGGDCLLEIGFDRIGSKKLMLKAAARYIKITG